MGRRGDQLQRLFDGLSRGDPGAILTVVGIVAVVVLVIYFRSKQKRE